MNSQLIQIEGIGKVKATEILALVELSRRIEENVPLVDVLNCTSPEVIIRYYHHLFLEKKQGRGTMRKKKEKRKF